MPTVLDLLGIAHSAPVRLDGMSHAHSLRSAELSTTQALTLTHTHTHNTHDAGTDTTATADGPRKYLLYNVYTNVEGKAYNVLTNANAAVRDRRYKLIHAFVNNSASLWYPYSNDTTQLSMSASTVVNTVSVAASSDDISETDVCPLYAAMEGSFALMLFDLQSDPYETTNLYNNLTYHTVQVSDVLQLSY